DDTRRQHGDDFVRARHATERKEQHKQQRDREEDNENLRHLGGVIADRKRKSEMFVDESRDIVTDVEDEPDGEKAGNAVDIDLQKIANDVAVEQAHGLD